MLLLPLCFNVLNHAACSPSWQWHTPWIDFRFSWVLVSVSLRCRVACFYNVEKGSPTLAWLHCGAFLVAGLRGGALQQSFLLPFQLARKNGNQPKHPKLSIPSFLVSQVSIGKELGVASSRSCAYSRAGSQVTSFDRPAILLLRKEAVLSAKAPGPPLDDQPHLHALTITFGITHDDYELSDSLLFQLGASLASSQACLCSSKASTSGLRLGKLGNRQGAKFGATCSLFGRAED